MQSITLYADKITALRKKLGKNLIIVGHHYQHDDVIAHVDFAGDSLQLAQMMETNNAKHIVFCGVHFMAESACLLAKEGQSVYLPDQNASCLMAEMTPADLLDSIIEQIKTQNPKRKIIPLAYVNTSLAVKTIVGKHDGSICTSANADKMLEWAYSQGDCVFFLPDQNLGNNVGNIHKISHESRHTLNVSENGKNLDFERINKAKLIFWPGCCPIHEYFTTDQILQMRKEYPNAKIYLHPECPQELVNLSDGSGSTSFLIKMAKEADKGSTVIIGTEYNLVARLTKQFPDKKVIPLYKAICPDMAKVTETNLFQILDEIDKKIAKPVTIDSSLTNDAKKTIDRMLAHCAK